MNLKIAFAGLRHNHIFSLLRLVEKSNNCQVVALAEEDDATREKIKRDFGFELVFRNYVEMFKNVDCDAVAVGEYFGYRGQVVLAALRQGKHVIADKPICVAASELKEISEVATAHKLKIGCMLDLRSNENFNALKQFVNKGALGKIHAISVGAQHPLLYSTRPKWYFEPGCYGGVINDIGIHVVDLVEWITRDTIVEAVAARCWNGFASATPHFLDCGQFMAVTSSGCGLMADVSYSLPNSCGVKTPYYWEVKIWGEAGMAVASLGENGVRVVLESNKKIIILPPCRPSEPDYLSQFLADIEGSPSSLDTARILVVSRKTLLLQQCADEKRYAVSLE